jgi:hypothetical protein
MKVCLIAGVAAAILAAGGCHNAAPATVEPTPAQAESKQAVELEGLKAEFSACNARIQASAVAAKDAAKRVSCKDGVAAGRETIAAGEECQRVLRKLEDLLGGLPAAMQTQRDVYNEILGEAKAGMPRLLKKCRKQLAATAE